jgi:hypothetical protein
MVKAEIKKIHKSEHWKIINRKQDRREGREKNT